MCAFSVNRETINWLQFAPADDGFHQFCGEVADGGTDGGDRLGQEAGDRVLTGISFPLLSVSISPVESSEATTKPSSLT